MNEKKALDYYNNLEARYEELVRLLDLTVKSLKKKYRKIVNEPPSDDKFERMELMQFAIDRVETVFNWDAGIRKKVENKHKRELEEMHKEQERLMRIKRAKELPQEKPLFNKRCRYFAEYIQGDKKWQECSLDVPLEYCSRKCAFASNAVASTPNYDAPVEINHRRVKTHHE